MKPCYAFKALWKVMCYAFLLGALWTTSLATLLSCLVWNYKQGSNNSWSFLLFTLLPWGYQCNSVAIYYAKALQCLSIVFCVEALQFCSTDWVQALYLQATIRAISLYFSLKWGICVIDRVLIVNGSNQRCCLLRVKEPAGLFVCVCVYIYIYTAAAKTHLLFGLEHMLVIQTVAAAFLIWWRNRPAEIKLFNKSYIRD